MTDKTKGLIVLFLLAVVFFVEVVEASPPPPVPWAVSGFSTIRPINSNFTVNGDFRITFINNYRQPVSVTNIAFFDSPKRNCKISTVFPFTINPGATFVAEGTNCPLEDNYIQLSINISYIIFLEDGTISNITHSSIGDMSVDTHPMPSDNLRFFIYLGVLVVIIAIPLAFIFRKNPEIKNALIGIILVIISLFLLGYIWINLFVFH